MTTKKRGDLKIDSNTRVRCKTKDLAERVLQVAHDLGYMWHDGVSYIDNHLFEPFQSKTAYNLHEGDYGKACIYRIYGHKIISAKKFLKLHGKWEETKPTETPAYQIDLTKLPIGTKVWSFNYGNGVITRKEQCYEGELNPLVVKFSAITTGYLPNGFLHRTCNHQDLGPSKEAFLANPLNPWATYDFSQHEPIKEEETEESPYNEDGSIKKGWLCEFVDNDESHSMHIGFLHSICEDGDFLMFDRFGTGTGMYGENCRPIPRSEWPDWAVEAHKTLKL